MISSLSSAIFPIFSNFLTFLKKGKFISVLTSQVAGSPGNPFQSLITPHAGDATPFTEQMHKALPDARLIDTHLAFLGFARLLASPNLCDTAGERLYLPFRTETAFISVKIEVRSSRSKSCHTKSATIQGQGINDRGFLKRQYPTFYALGPTQLSPQVNYQFLYYILSEFQDSSILGYWYPHSMPYFTT